MDRLPLRVLIVDDEPVARQVLREGLALIPDTTVAGEASNGLEALQRTRELQPDLLLLDLQMPVMNGIEVVRSLDQPGAPAVVIVTAFDQHAIAAFEAGAIDYLLKPVNEVRLAAAVQRARSLKPAEIADQNMKIAAATPADKPIGRRVVGRQGQDYYLLDLSEVLAFQAQGELVWIITARQRFLATQSLGSIESRLEGAHFQRVHRNAIVNVNHVRKMAALSSQRWLITMSNSLEMIVSKRKAHIIRQLLEW